jgi:chitinase
MMSFVKPDCAYTKGSLTLGGTGLDFSSSGSVVRDAVATLKARNPNTHVLLAVGGATYTNFAGGRRGRVRPRAWLSALLHGVSLAEQGAPHRRRPTPTAPRQPPQPRHPPLPAPTRPGLNTQCIKDIVTDFGLDGADIDWEPSGPNCVASGGTISCPTDAEAITAATKMRQALPKGQYLLSTASFHVGCYGTGAFAASKPNSVVRGLGLGLPLLSAAGVERACARVRRHQMRPIKSWHTCHGPVSTARPFPA